MIDYDWYLSRNLACELSVLIQAIHDGYHYNGVIVFLQSKGSEEGEHLLQDILHNIGLFYSMHLDLGTEKLLLYSDVKILYLTQSSDVKNLIHRILLTLEKKLKFNCIYVTSDKDEIEQIRNSGIHCKVFNVVK